MVSLVGASGTGKSTLLRIIAGLEEANAGRITYAGQPLSAGQVGFVFSTRFCTRICRFVRIFFSNYLARLPPKGR